MGIRPPTRRQGSMRGGSGGSFFRPTSDRASAKLKEFLEKTPPNSPLVIPELAKASGFENRPGGPVFHWAVNPPPELIHLHCEVDDGVRRFSLDRSASSAFDFGFCFVEYRCRDCGRVTKTYAIATQLIPGESGDGEVRSAKVMKLGEFPPFGAPIASRIQRLLDTEDLELYRKGCRSEAQGLGIGAATYFRRIVESHWKRLVTDLRNAAERIGHTDLAVFDSALQETQFSAAVGMLRDAIPAKLLILDGQNPLTLLYRPLSAQLHELTDEECLQEAADIRIVLTALLENIADVLKDQEELRSAATRLRDRRRK